MGEAKRRRAAIARGDEPDDAECQRLCNAAEDEGCSNCGAYFGSGLPYFVVRLAPRVFANRCIHCRLVGEATPIITAV
jgi:hypothetical protein